MKIRSITDLVSLTHKSKRLLTLFSGGLDSSYILKILADQDCDVTALAIDLGDGVNLADLKEIADRFGARLRVIDGRKDFAESAVLPAIQANAKYMGMYPISSSLSRPVIARYAVQVAKEEGCDAIIHTANQSQNTLRRLNGAISQLGYKGFFGSPYEYSAIPREQKISELSLLGLPRFQARGISGDANLWCREFESGSLDNPEGFSTPESLYEWTRKPVGEPPAEDITVQFDRGIPVAFNDEDLPLVELIAKLNMHAGAYGIGRYAGLEHLDQGEKVLEVREAPAACILLEAYRHLEMAALDAELLREKQSLEQVWVREAIEGRWFSPLRNAIQSFISATATQVEGAVAFRLRPGAADVCSIQAAHPLYLTDRDAWETKVSQERGSRTLFEEMAVA